MRPAPPEESKTAASTALPPGPPEVIVVDSHRVWCDGGGGALGHPRVYMEMGDSHAVECGYCDRRFVLRGFERPEDEETAPGAWDGAAGR